MLFFSLTPHFRTRRFHFSPFQIHTIIWYLKFWQKWVFSKISMLQCSFLVQTLHFRPRWVHFSHFQVPKIIWYPKFGHIGSKMGQNWFKRVMLGYFLNYQWYNVIFSPNPPFLAPLGSFLTLSGPFKVKMDF